MKYFFWEKAEARWAGARQQRQAAARIADKVSALPEAAHIFAPERGRVPWLGGAVLRIRNS